MLAGWLAWFKRPFYSCFASPGGRRQALSPIALSTLGCFVYPILLIPHFITQHNLSASSLPHFWFSPFLPGYKQDQHLKMRAANTVFFIFAVAGLAMPVWDSSSQPRAPAHQEKGGDHALDADSLRPAWSRRHGGTESPGET